MVEERTDVLTQDLHAATRFDDEDLHRKLHSERRVGLHQRRSSFRIAEDEKRRRWKLQPRIRCALRMLDHGEDGQRAFLEGGTKLRNRCGEIVCAVFGDEGLGSGLIGKLRRDHRLVLRYAGLAGAE